MEQQFQDTLFRLVEDRKERDAQIARLEARLTSDRADFDKRFREALAQSDEQIALITSQLQQARVDDRRSLEEQVARMHDEKKVAEQEHVKWQEQVDALNEDIKRLTVRQQGADGQERMRLEARIKELEAKKAKKGKMFALKIGAGLLASAFGPLLTFMLGV